MWGGGGGGGGVQKWSYVLTLFFDGESVHLSRYNLITCFVRRYHLLYNGLWKTCVFSGLEQFVSTNAGMVSRPSGRVVRKPINANRRLKVNRGFLLAL